LNVYNDTLISDYFYIDYISGDALMQKDGGIKNNPTNIAEYNYDFDYTGTF